MNILEQIVVDKKKDLVFQKEFFPLTALEKSIQHVGNQRSLKQLLSAKQRGVIAEYKRRSPSKNNINLEANVNTVVQGYARAGAVAISVLTNLKYFGGTNRDLVTARSLVEIPILRKEFIVEPYQVYESKALGADVILLIASILTPQEIKTMASLAQALGLEVLLEVHDRDELDSSYCEFIDFVGVNNRNLKTFEVDIQNSIDLLAHMPANVLTISESGLSNFTEIATLAQAGFNGFLIGETFMKTPSPELTCSETVRKLNQFQLVC